MRRKADFAAMFLHRRLLYDDRKSTAWNAPINPNAFCERDIYYYVEDADGEKIGNATIARGKYIWCKDEDFSLFELKAVQVKMKLYIQYQQRKKPKLCMT